MTQEMLEVANKERIAFTEQMEQEERIQVCTLILFLFAVFVLLCVCVALSGRVTEAVGQTERTVGE